MSSMRHVAEEGQEQYEQWQAEQAMTASERIRAARERDEFERQAKRDANDEAIAAQKLRAAIRRGCERG